MHPIRLRERASFLLQQDGSYLAPGLQVPQAIPSYLFLDLDGVSEFARLATLCCFFNLLLWLVICMKRPLLLWTDRPNLSQWTGANREVYCAIWRVAQWRGERWAPPHLSCCYGVHVHFGNQDNPSLGSDTTRGKGNPQLWHVGWTWVVDCERMFGLVSLAWPAWVMQPWILIFFWGLLLLHPWESLPFEEI